MARKRSHASKKQKHNQNVDNIPMDSEDEFHQQNESIPLDDSTHLSDDDSDNEQEVYGLKGVDAGDDDDDDEDIDIGDYEQVPDDTVDLPEQDDDDDEEQESDVEQDPRKLKSWGSRQSAYYSRQDENQSEDDQDAEQTRKLEQEEALNLQKSSREQWSWDDVNAIDGVDDEEECVSLSYRVKITPSNPLIQCTTGSSH